jgi:thioredoxin reductase
LADHETADVAIVGGSLAGLQAALTLGRAVRSVAVIDDGHPRKARFWTNPGLLGPCARATTEQPRGQKGRIKMT